MTIHREMYKEKTKEANPTVIVSGGFDPVHAGHIRMIRDAANFGDVIVIANSDDWLLEGLNLISSQTAEIEEDQILPSKQFAKKWELNYYGVSAAIKS